MKESKLKCDLCGVIDDIKESKESELKCDLCGKPVSHMRNTKEEPPEYSVCSKCGGKFCDDCIDYLIMAKRNTVDVICKECSKHDVTKE